MYWSPWESVHTACPVIKFKIRDGENCLKLRIYLSYRDIVAWKKITFQWSDSKN